MDLSPSVLGQNTATQLTARRRHILLSIGKDGFTRSHLSKVECFNFNAAASLSAALASFDVKDTRDVYERISPLSLALPRIGCVAIAVLGAAFEAKKIGGETPLKSWVTHHLEKGKDVVTFSSTKNKIKHVTEATEKRQASKTRTGRVHKARAIRTKRFLAQKEN